jgi:hypothetical protein
MNVTQMKRIRRNGRTTAEDGVAATSARDPRPQVLKWTWVAVIQLDNLADYTDR